MSAIVLLVPDALIQNDPAKTTLKSGEIVQYCRVLYMGGELRVVNAAGAKSGPAKDVRVEISFRESARAYGAKDNRPAGAMVTKEAQFGNLVSVGK